MKKLYYRTIEMIKKSPKIYIAKCTMRKRGWTKKMFEKFFPNPTMEVTNPHYASAPTMKLYRIIEVLAIEQTEPFKTYWMKIAHKRAKARAMMIERHKRARALRLVPHTDGMTNQRA